MPSHRKATRKELTEAHNQLLDANEAEEKALNKFRAQARMLDIQLAENPEHSAVDDMRAELRTLDGVLMDTRHAKLMAEGEYNYMCWKGIRIGSDTAEEMLVAQNID